MQLKAEKTLLQNGLKIVTHRRQDIGLVYIYLAIRVGSIYESENEKGISHFLEHSIFGGSQKWETIEAVGGTMNAFTSKDVTMVFCSVLSKYFETAVKLLSEIALSPQFDIEQVSKEKNVIQEEIAKQTSIDKAYQSMIEELFPDHPVKYSVLGTGDYKKEALQKFHSKHYMPGNMTIAVVGQTQHAEAVNIIEKYFHNNQRNPIQMTFPDYQPLNSSKKHKKKLESPVTIFGFRSPNIKSAESIVVDLIGYSLGEMATFGARNIVRFRSGLAYSVKSAKNGYISGSFAALLVLGQKSENIIKEILSFLDIFRQNKLNTPTYQRIINSYLGQHYAQNEDPSSAAKRLAYCHLYDVEFLLDVEDKLPNPDQIQEAVDKYFGNYVIVMP